MPLQRQEEDDSSSQNFQQDLAHIPEELHAEARADPRQISWPWSNPQMDAPSGKYRKTHICTDEACPIPPDIDLAKEYARRRGEKDLSTGLKLIRNALGGEGMRGLTTPLGRWVSGSCACILQKLSCLPLPRWDLTRALRS